MRASRRTRTRRRRHGAIASVVALAAGLCVASVAAPTAPPAAAADDPCTSTPNPADVDFLLPPWSDTSGWSKPDQYETIQGADTDGDGAGEIIGRNANALEVFEWSPIDATMGAAAPGQWTASPIPGPPTPETDWFFDPSVYSTLQAADLDGDGADEVFWRSTSGVVVYDLSNGAWSGPAAGPAWGDTNPLGDAAWEEPYYGTIQAGDVDGDGDEEIVGRSSAGMQSWAEQADGTFEQLEEPSSLQVFPDSQGWDAVDYTSSIQLADLTGDGAADLLARSSNGLLLYSFEVTNQATGQGTWQAVAGSGPWTDADGWKDPAYESTITTADLDGDGTAEVVGRGPYGLDVWAWDTTTTAWVEQMPAPSSGSPSVLTDAQGFDQVQAYSTVQAADLVAGQPALMMALWPDGLHTYSFTSGSGFTDTGSTITQFSQANGWNQPVRYLTVGSVPTATGQGSAVIGKDTTGVRTYTLGSVGGTFADPSEPFPVWTQPGAPPSPELTSYQHLNDVAVTEGGTILGELQILTADLDQLGTNIQAAKPPQFGNVPRATWESVKATTYAWTEAAQNLRGYLGVGTGSGSGVYQLVLQGYITGSSGESINAIGQEFTGGNPAVLALIGDLIWGSLGAIPGGQIFTAPADAAKFTAAMSLTGSGVSAGMGFANPDGRVNSEVQKLEADVQNAFCTSVLYLNLAYGQIAADLGQLTAMEQMMADGPLQLTGQTYDDALTASNTARQVWAYQQFASMDHSGWRIGYCEGGTTCVLSPGGQYGVGDYAYKAIPTDSAGTPNCDHDPFGSGTVTGWNKVLDLGVDPTSEVFQPAIPDARSSVGVAGAPYTQLQSSSGAAGILGWRTELHSCHS